MNILNIINRFKTMSGTTSAEANELVDIINDSMSFIDKVAGEGAEIEDNVQIFENAAAALSFYKYTLYLAGSGRLRGFSAGDFKLDDGDTAVDGALRIWQQAQTEMMPFAQNADLLNADEFAFKSV